MRVTLIFPPVYYPWFISPGIAYLAGHIPRCGHGVEIRDTNAAALEYVLVHQKSEPEITEALHAMRDP